MVRNRFFSVTQLNKYIKGILETDIILSHVWLKGEISNLKRNSSGHTFFSLKDRTSAISCVLFKTAGEIMDIKLVNGAEVFLYGYVSLYERTGSYQFYVENAEVSGKGALEAQFLALRKKLEAEGLFDEDFKRNIPAYAEDIAVITSPDGAAVRDIIRTIRKKNEKINIKIIPVTVQGDKAPGEIERALDYVNKNVKADIVIVSRGGGSIEDLWAFNEENVARAVFRSEIPVISGVGHETDYTITDFVADLRAATPTAAAEAASWNYAETLYDTELYMKKIESLFLSNLQNKKQNLDNLTEKAVLKNPKKLLELSKYDFRFYSERLKNCGDSIIEEKLNKLELLKAKLEGLSPFFVMKRGYSLVYDTGGKAVGSVKDLKKGDGINIHFGDGCALAEVKDLKESRDGEKENQF